MISNDHKKHLRSKTSGCNISNLYDLSVSLSPYITDLNLNSFHLKNGTIKFYNDSVILNINKNNETSTKTYTIPDPITSDSNVLLSSPSYSTINIKEQKKINIDSPSGKIIVSNGDCLPGHNIKFTLDNSFIKNYNNILLTINKFNSDSIPVCIVEDIFAGSCNICVYNAGINNLPSIYNIVFLVI